MDRTLKSSTYYVAGLITIRSDIETLAINKVIE
jgi:hypothetical protein